MLVTASQLVSQDAEMIWHPFTQHGLEQTTIPIARAKDASLFTYDNHEIIDCISSWWTITHGHNQPDINQAIYNQLSDLSHVMFAGFTHKPAIDLAQRLLSLNHNLFSKVFFADNGSTAIEIALKLSYQYHYNLGFPDKKVFLHFEGGYHGDTFGAMSTGRTSGFYEPFEPFFCQTVSIPFPTIEDDIEKTIKSEEKALAVLELVLETYKEKIACMILEPLLQGAIGMRLCRAEFIDKLVGRLKENKILTIFDEVATGFGRLGKMFAHEFCTQKPDILCLSKGLTGGYMPLSATLVNQEIYDAFLGNHYKNAFTHGHSFTANPLACSAAVASIDLFQTHQTFDRIAHIQTTYQEIIPEFKYHSLLTNFRTIGTMLAWDIVSKDAHYKTKEAEKIKDNLLKAGYNMRPLGKTFYLLPPYCIHGLSVHLRKILSFFD